MFGGSPFDFGFPWWMTWGHLIPLVVFTGIGFAAWRLGWRRSISVASLLFALWSLAGFVILHQVLAVNRPLSPPSPQFLMGGSGRVLDLGAGSGRATLMVLQNRPNTTVVALDLYSGYWGINDNTPDRLRRNAAAAGVQDRVDVQVGDMRELPFADASFDGIVSSFAIDHLRRTEIPVALRESARVLRPGGDLLILNLNVDGWIRVALPTLPGHGYFGRELDFIWWRNALIDAGFGMVEQGTQPGTAYFLANKREVAPVSVKR